MSIAPRDEPEASELPAIGEESEALDAPEVVQPDGWAQPRGYTNGVIASGKVVTLAGQVGWNPETCTFDTDDFAAQARQIFHNIVALLLDAGARPHDLVRLTWFIVDRPEYVAARKEVGAAYREIIGSHYPPMSVVFVTGLLEERARLEIEATAIIPLAADHSR
jgi:enamine deaminase RidA (YjgF/YER057c/UK114 family)